MEVLPRRLLLRCDSAFYPPTVGLVPPSQRGLDMRIHHRQRAVDIRIVNIRCRAAQHSTGLSLIIINSTSATSSQLLWLCHWHWWLKVWSHAGKSIWENNTRIYSQTCTYNKCKQLLVYWNRRVSFNQLISSFFCHFSTKVTPNRNDRFQNAL